MLTAPHPPSLSVVGQPADREAVDIAQAAEMLATTQSMIKREIRRGALRGFKLGRQWRVRVSELRAYMMRKEKQQSARQTIPSRARRGRWARGKTLPLLEGGDK